MRFGCLVRACLSCAQSSIAQFAQPVREKAELLAVMSLWVAFGSAGFASRTWATTSTGAVHLIVDPSGGGNFTTIQAAIDSLRAVPLKMRVAHAAKSGGADTIEVRAGDYDETVTLPVDAGAVMHCPSGPATTRVRHLDQTPGSHFGNDWLINGLRVTELVAISGQASPPAFTNCVFDGGVRMRGECSDDNLSDCVIYGRSVLDGYSSSAVFERLRFVNGTLYAGTDACGPVSYVDCTFEGATDTLVYGDPDSGKNGLSFTNCRFTRSKLGVIFRRTEWNTMQFSRCVFTQLSQAGLWFDEAPGSPPYSSGSPPSRLSTEFCRFDSCGTGIHWLPANSTQVSMKSDTVRYSGGIGILVSSSGCECQPPEFDQLVVEFNGSHGMVLDTRRSCAASLVESVILRDSRFANNVGHGLRVQDTTRVDSRTRSLVAGCRFEQNTGAGLSISSTAWTVTHNVAYRNHGAGLVLATTQAGYEDSVMSNSSVRNGGDGIRTTGHAGAGSAPLSVQYNLAAADSGTGLQVDDPDFGSVAFNDSWQNVAGSYNGFPAPMDSNHVSDPLFCAEGLGDLTLHSNSPCGPNGVFGPIGALGVGCGSTVGAPPVAVLTSVSIRPNPASGHVEFAVPRGIGGGRYDVHDLTGRIIWSGLLHDGESALRWNGTALNGAAIPPGPYFVRFTRGEEQRSARLVWLK